MKTLEKQLEKVTQWWNEQPDESAATIQSQCGDGGRCSKMKNATTDEIVLKVMTVAMLMSS
jgi:hypothetical protein